MNASEEENVRTEVGKENHIICGFPVEGASRSTFDAGEAVPEA